MRFHLTTLKRSFLAILLTGLSLGHGRGQATDANGQIVSPIVFDNHAAITTKLVTAPILGHDDNFSSSDNNTQWLKVEFHYAVTPKEGGAPFVDAVEFRVWVEGRDLYDPAARTADGIAVALTGTVTYVNLRATRDGYGAVYISPSALTRYSTKNGASDFTDKFNVHIEAYVGGAKVDYFDKNKEPDLNWYKALRAVTGMVYRQDQCAFIVSDSSRYPQLKLNSPGQ